MSINGNTTIAIGLFAIFIGLGVAGAGGASDEAIGTIAIVGLFAALAMIVRIDRGKA